MQIVVVESLARVVFDLKLRMYLPEHAGEHTTAVLHVRYGDDEHVSVDGDDGDAVSGYL